MCFHSYLTPPAFSPCDRPRVIESLRGIEVVDIAAGGAHSACITASGELFTWGKGRYGRLGHGDSEDHLKPKLVSQHFWCIVHMFTDMFQQYLLLSEFGQESEFTLPQSDKVSQAITV